MTTVYLIVLGLLAAAAAMTLYRLVRGPTMLDRAVSLDVLTAVVMCAVGAGAATYRDYQLLPILLVLSLLGFVGSISLARFFAGRAR